MVENRKTNDVNVHGENIQPHYYSSMKAVSLVCHSWGFIYLGLYIVLAYTAGLKL